MKKLLAQGSIIQIDVTNACVNQCSNCTRFIGHQKKRFFMDTETYRKAVDSLEGYRGIVGMIGGEPLLHPKFEEMSRYVESRVAEKERRGLWSTVPTQKYNDVIREVYGTIYVNDHSNNKILHAPMLASVSELIADKKEMWERIESCWVYECWSPTITPKGAFFCEVAGALDMLFKGPGGWPIEPGWWQRTPEDYRELKERWCTRCGGCLTLARRPSTDEIDDVTPENLKALLAVGSPRAERGRVNVWQGGLDGGWKPHPNCYMDEMPDELAYRKRLWDRLGFGAEAAPDLLVVDPGFVLFSGHHCDFNLGVHAACAAAGIRDSYFIPSFLQDLDILRQVLGDVEPALDKYYFYRASPDSKCGYLEHYLHQGERFADILRKVCAGRIGGDSLVLFHTLDVPAFLGVAKWYSGLPESLKPRIFLCFHWLDADSVLERQAFAFAAKMLADSPKARFFSTSAVVAASISELAYGQKGEWLPFPFGEGKDRTFDRDAPLFGLTGDVRLADRALDIFAPAVHAYLSEGGRGDFRISLCVDGHKELPLLKVIQKLAGLYPDRVSFAQEILVGESYRDYLASVDALVLLHKPEHYRNRSSKVFAEAVTYGLPLIMGDGSDMAGEAREHGCAAVFLPEMTAPELTKALFAMEKDFAACRRQAAEASARYARFHNPENMLRVLLGDSQAVTAPAIPSSPSPL